jgi:hypothetical protein
MKKVHWNGTSAKPVLTEIGPVPLPVPQGVGRAGSSRRSCRSTPAVPDAGRVTSGQESIRPGGTGFGTRRCWPPRQRPAAQADGEQAGV